MQDIAQTRNALMSLSNLAAPAVLLSRPAILVTGASGKTGGVVVAELLKAGYPVRALVHREDARSIALRTIGAEVVVADMCDTERVFDAMRGMQRAYFVPPIDPYALQGAAVFAAATAQARLESIVSISQWLASPSHPSLMTRHMWLTEQLFVQIPNVGYTLVNPGLFVELPYLVTIDFVAHLGVYPAIFGERRDAPPSVNDIARVCAAALMDPNRHAGRRYRPTGPELLDAGDMAGILGKVFDRRVVTAPTPLWVFERAARYGGFSIAVLSSLGHYVEDHRRGAFEIDAPNDVVREVTGRAPESFAEVARRHVARVPRTLSARLATLAQFIATPLLPAFNLKRYERELRSPRPGEALYAMQSAVWRKEHAGGRMEAGGAEVAPLLHGAVPSPVAAD